MSEEYDLARAFRRIEDSLIDSMMRNFKRHRAEEDELGYNWEQWQVKQLEALEEYRRSNREKFSTEFADLNSRIEEMLRATAHDAAYKQEQKILRAIKKGFRTKRSSDQLYAEFFRLNQRKMDALITATTDDMRRAEYAVLRMSNDKYRQAIFDAQVYMNSGAATYEQAVDMAVKDMLSAGLNCVEYSNGARHTLPDYSEMAIRTANKRAYLRGQGDMLNKYGVTTVIINRRHGACGKCADYVGMVFIDDVYAGGKPTDAGGKYPLLSDAMKSGLFHPRCKDSASPYFEGISTPPDREVLPKKAQEDLTEIERAEQKEQYGRRMEKMYRRLEKFALDPGNKKLYAGRRSQWSEYTEKWQSYHEYRKRNNAIYVEITSENRIANIKKSGVAGNTATIETWENNNYKNIAEKGLLITSKGQAIDFVGTDHHVTGKLDDIKKMNGGVFTHNHPINNTFSQNDIVTGLVKGNLSELRAVTSTGDLHILVNNGATEEQRKQFSTAYQQRRLKAANVADSKIRKGERINKDEYVKGRLEAFLSEKAKDYNLVYIKTNINIK